MVKLSINMNLNIVNEFKLQLDNFFNSDFISSIILKLEIYYIKNYKFNKSHAFKVKTKN